MLREKETDRERKKQTEKTERAYFLYQYFKIKVLKWRLSVYKSHPYKAFNPKDTAKQRESN